MTTITTKKKPTTSPHRRRTVVAIEAEAAKLIADTETRLAVAETRLKVAKVLLPWLRSLDPTDYVNPRALRAVYRERRWLLEVKAAPRRRRPEPVPE
jgi:hypothetical protein